MFDSLFQRYQTEHDKDFTKILTDGYVFTDFFRRMMLELKDNMHLAKYNKFCEGGFAEYKGDAACAYNTAKALVLTKQHLKWNVSDK